MLYQLVLTTSAILPSSAFVPLPFTPLYFPIRAYFWVLLRFSKILSRPSTTASFKYGKRLTSLFVFSLIIVLYPSALLNRPNKIHNSRHSWRRWQRPAFAAAALLPPISFFAVVPSQKSTHMAVGNFVFCSNCCRATRKYVKWQFGIRFNIHPPAVLQ